MTTTEKLRALRALSGLNPHRFARLIQVSPSTIARLEAEGTPDRPGPDTLQKLADTFQEITLDWLLDPLADDLPDQLTLTGTPLAALTAARQQPHEGRALRRFLDRHDVAGKDLAAAAGVSAPAVTKYLDTERFRRSVRDNILAALQKHLGRPVTAAEVFGQPDPARPAATIPAEALLAVPRLALRDRATLSPDTLTALQQRFAPALDPASAHFVARTGIAHPDRAYALEVGPADRMESAGLRPGYWVLALLLTPDDYPRLRDGLVAVQLSGSPDLLLKKVLGNQLATGGHLELGPAQPGQGAALLLRPDDLTLLFHLTRLLDGPL